MSDIKVGDLVVVVRGHICDLGRVFVVMEISNNPCEWDCPDCGYQGPLSIEPWAHCSGLWGTPFSWLRKIPPLSELDDVKRKIEEPA